jgi:hypothetical protein
MTKKVRLVIDNNTDGTDKIEVGTATVDEIPNGDLVVNLTITNAAIIEAIGGKEIKGIVPRAEPYTRPHWTDED